MTADRYELTMPATDIPSEAEASTVTNIETSGNYFIDFVRDTLLRGGRLTKWAGHVASYAPMIGTQIKGMLAPVLSPVLAPLAELSFSSFLRAKSPGRALGAAMVAAGALLATGQPAYANCVETFPGSGSWSCSVPTVTTQALTPAVGGGQLSVTAVPGFDINTAAGDAFTLINTPIDTDIIFVDFSESTIIGAENGINADNQGTGFTSIFSSSDVTANNGTGVLVHTGATTTYTDIFTSGTVYGSDSGIYAESFGSEGLTITATGDTTGQSDYGIKGYNRSTAPTSFLLIEQDAGATASGASDGIVAASAGGTLTIRAYGTSEVIGNSGANGITGYLAPGGTDLSITAYHAAGTEYGISASNAGTGSTDIVVTDGGTANGTDYAGIRTSNTASGTSLSVTTGLGSTVSGGEYGIRARNYGTEGLTISVSGDVTGTDYDGINAYNSANDVSGSMLIQQDADTTTMGGEDGIDADNFGGSLTIEAYGTSIGQTQNGINAVNQVGTTDLLITANNATGANNGIRAVNQGTGTTSVTTTGIVNTYAYGGDGISVNNSANGTSLSVTVESGQVDGYFNGIGATNFGAGPMSISTYGDVSGSVFGIQAFNSPDDGVQDVSLYQGANTTISGGLAGIYLVNYGGSATINSLGYVTASTDAGISAGNRGTDTVDLDVTAHDVHAGRAIVVENFGTGETNVTTTGTVTGTAEDGILVTNTTLATSMSVTTGVGGSVSGNQYGIDARNKGTGGLTISVGGDVTGDMADGVNAYNRVSGVSGSLIQQAVDTTTMGNRDGISAENRGGALTIHAYGSSVGYVDGAGIDAFNGASATDVTIIANNASGATYGINAYNNGTGSLSVTATGAVSGAQDDGIRAQNISESTTLSVTTEVGSTVYGKRHGINARNYGTGGLTISVSGDVTGDTGHGINAYNSVNDDMDSMLIEQDADTMTMGMDHGINALNGAGSLTIEAYGTSIGKTINGINAVNYAGTTDLSITANNATGDGDGIFAENYGSGALSVHATGYVKGEGNDGIDAINHNGTSLSVTTGMESTVYGRDIGIDAQNDGSGSLTIEALGDVTGKYDDGIAAFNSVGSTESDITAHNVSGGEHGILAVHLGSGALSVTATGIVDGAGADGISAQNTDAGTSLSVTTGAGAVSGDEDGIEARNFGTGGLTISVGGDVTGNTGSGINAYNSVNDEEDSLLIEQDAGTTSMGMDHGINAQNGAGSLTIEAYGTSIGETGNGINAFNDVGTTDLTINAYAADGEDNGVRAENLGTGATEVTTTGVVNGANYDGIRVSAYSGTSLTVTAGPGSVSGYRDGIDVRNFGSGDLTIVSSAAVTGQLDNGIDGRNYGGGSASITVETGGSVAAYGSNGLDARNFGIGLSVTTETGTTVYGKNNGLRARNDGTGGLTVSVSGDVTGATESGIYAFSSANDVSSSMLIEQGVGTTSMGMVHGINAENYGGSLTIEAYGTSIGETGNGINAINQIGTTDLSITANNVSGYNDAIQAQNLGTGATSITTTGIVNVTGNGGDGISAVNTASGTSLSVTVQSGQVNGRSNGIDARNLGSGDLSVSTYASVYGNNSVGIFALNTPADPTKSVSVYQAAGTTVSGGGAGIYVRNEGGAATITSYGYVTAVADVGIGAANDTGTTDLHITAHDVMARRAISAENLGTGETSVTTTGAVTSTNGIGIEVTNTAAATSMSVTTGPGAVYGAGEGIIANNQGSGALMVSTTGDVTGDGSTGLELNNEGTSLTLMTGPGTILGQLAGIEARNNGTGDLNVSIGGDVTSRYSNAVVVFNASADPSSSTMVHQAAGTTVMGMDTGIQVFEGPESLTIQAYGSVIGDYGNGIRAGTTGGGLSVTTGAGEIRGYFDGITTVNRGTGATTIETGSGAVNGLSGQGIYARQLDGTSLSITTGTGAVYGFDNGIKARNYGTGGLTIEVGGDVTGDTGYGINAYNSANDVSGSMLITQAVGTTTMGMVHGIYADNFGGSLTIEAYGTSIGESVDGIRAVNNAGTTDLSVTVHSATGESYGVHVDNFSAGTTSVATTGDIKGYTRHGIDAGGLLGTGDMNVTVASGTVYGKALGIAARNSGLGSLTVAVADGATVTGNDSSGIFARNSEYGTSLTVTTGTGAIMGGDSGIAATNLGSGGLHVSVSGDVTGNGFAGIEAYNSANDVSGSMLIQQAAGTTTTGQDYGIYAYNLGGSLTIEAEGSTVGETGDGINAINAVGTTDLSITANNVSSDGFGIRADNNGTGATSVTVSGAVTTYAPDSTGIFVSNTNAGSSMEVTTGPGAVYGYSDGIAARSYGSGPLAVSVSGDVTGKLGYGIYTYNQASSTLIQQTAETSTSGRNGGIRARGLSSSLTIEAYGSTTGENVSGIWATNETYATDLIIRAHNVYGYAYGIRAENEGAGVTDINVTGTVRASTLFTGIKTQNTASGTSMSVTTGAGTVYGLMTGIDADNNGTGGLTISVGGDVTGQDVTGILANNSANAGSGPLLLQQAAGSTITGFQDAITATNAGGAMTIEAYGTSIGRYGNGITALNNGGTSDLAIVANNVEGDLYGISATNDGDGATSVTTTGLVDGDGRDGVFVRNSSSGTTMSIATGPGTVSGRQDGIDANNQGTGGLTIEVGGDVTGDTGSGIDAYNSANGTSGSLLITQAAGTKTEGAGRGIDAYNRAGSLTIEAYGTTIGQTRQGIWAENFLGTNDLTVKAGNVEGNLEGIFAKNSGSGLTSVDVTGTVTSEGFTGVSAYTRGDGLTISTGEGAVSGGYFGIRARNVGTGATTVTTSTGAITGQGVGYAYYEYDDGIYVGNAPTGTTSLTVTTGTGKVQGKGSGINAVNRGSGETEVETVGDVIGEDRDGIAVQNTSSGTSISVTTGPGEVKGGDDGIDARNYGTGGLTISVSGDVTGQGGDGINAYNSANDVSGSMLITQDAETMTMGMDHGINANNYGGSLTIEAYGTSIGKTYEGIRAVNQIGTTDLSITANNVQGQQNGIFALNQGTGMTNITATGAVSGYGDDGIYVRNSALGMGMSVTTGPGTVYGRDAGIEVDHYGTGALTIDIGGDVTGQYGAGVFAFITNDASGPVLITQAADTTTKGFDDGIVGFNTGGDSLTIIAEGTVESGDGRGITGLNLSGTSDLSITANNVYGKSFGIDASNSGSGDTYVNVTGNVTSTGSRGISFSTGNNNTGDVTIKTGPGTISGYNGGITAGGIFGSGAITIETTGAVYGGYGDGIDANSRGGDLNITTGPGPVEGTYGILGGQDGAGALSITTSGDVTGTAYTAIWAQSNGSSLSIETGPGSVQGGYRGIAAYNYGAGATLITTTGDVTGQGLDYPGDSFDDGIYAINYAGSTSLTINTGPGTVTGAGDGIEAINYGTGGLEINVGGDVIAQGGDAITAYNSANDTTASMSVTQDAGTTSMGGVNGINATHLGSGGLTVDINGTVIGGTGAGIATATGLGGSTELNVNADADVSATSGVAITNDAGDSTTIISGDVTGEIRLGDGSDDLMFVGADLSGITVLDGGDDASPADGFVDTVTLDNVTATFNAGGLINWEVVGFVDSTVTVNDLAFGDVNVCGGSTTFGGAGMVDNVLGCVSDDTIEVTGNTIVSNAIEGAGGSDTIVVSGNASVVGGVFGAGAGQDGSAAADAGDVITINTTGTVGLVDGGAGGDSISLIEGTISTSIDAGVGDDTLVWSGGSVPLIFGGDGSDTLLVTAESYDGTQVLDGGDDVSIEDGFIDTLTLNGIVVAANGSGILNWEVIDIVGGAQLTLGDPLTTVDLNIVEGLVDMGAGAVDPELGALSAITGDIAVSELGTLEASGGGAGTFVVDGNVLNMGAVSTLDDGAGDVLTVTGNYNIETVPAEMEGDPDMVTEFGPGALWLDIDTPNAAADLLAIEGDTGGLTTITVNDIGTGSGAYEEILLVDTADAQGHFLLAGGVHTAGAVDYVLETSDGAFLSPSLRDAPQGYSMFGTAVQAFLTQGVGTMNERMGALKKYQDGRYGVWARFQYLDGDVAPDTNPEPGIAFDMDGYQVSFGIEMIRKAGNGGRVHFGLSGGLGDADYDLVGVASRTDFESAHVGGYATWESGGGFYLDAVLNYHWLDAEFDAPAEAATASTDGEALVFSIEGGKRFSFDSGFDVIPEVQLIFADIDFDSFEDSGGLVVSHLDGNSLKGRLGVRLQHAFSAGNSTTVRPFLTLDVLHEFEGDNVIDVSGLELTSTFDGTSYAIGGGLEVDWGTGSFYVKGSYEDFGSGQGDIFDIIAGAKFRW